MSELTLTFKSAKEIKSILLQCIKDEVESFDMGGQHEDKAINNINALIQRAKEQIAFNGGIEYALSKGKTISAF